MSDEHPCGDPECPRFEIPALTAEIERLKTELKEEKEFLHALGEKAPHLMGCALLGSGTWLCDERCLVNPVEQLKDSLERLRKEKEDLLRRLTLAHVPHDGTLDVAITNVLDQRDRSLQRAIDNDRR